MTSVSIGIATTGETLSLALAKACRHGLIAGSTGGGKTVTIQKLAEQFSAAGIPVFIPDIKGDISGIAASGSGKGCPVSFWDLYGTEGMRIVTSVQEMGSDLLSAMMGLNPAQSATLAIAFQKAEDDRDFLLSLDDLRWMLNDLSENREQISAKYGNVTNVSLAAIRRSIFVLESQGGANLFGEPAFDINDLLQQRDGRGIINLLSADRLIESPKLYSIFLLWLLRELFRKLPEVGDVAKPKMVFMFDESHLLFRDAPKPLLQEIERLVRLIRSKGVGVYFASQSPADIPDSVLAQLGNRFQHCLRAYTRKDQAMVRAAADAFRQDRSLDVRKVVTELGIGEAIVSVLDLDGVPTMAKRVKVGMPASLIGPISKIERDSLRAVDTLFSKYSGTDSTERQAAAFNARMLAARGIEVSPSETDWKDGDFKAFVPDFAPANAAKTKSAGHLLRNVAMWAAVVAGACFYIQHVV